MIPVFLFGVLIAAGLAMTPLVNLDTDEPDEPRDSNEPDEPVTPDETEEPDEPVDPEEPLVLNITNEDELAQLGMTLDGTTANDDIAFSVDTNDTLTDVNLGDGEDTFSGRAFTGEVSVNGGTGDDTLTATTSGSDSGLFDLFGGEGNDALDAGTSTRAYGGSGDDVLTGADGSALYGGDGNDTLRGGSTGTFRFDFGRSADGGDGDDTLEIFREAGDISTNETDFGDWEAFSDMHRGGEGADTFDLRVNVNQELDYSGPVSGDQLLLDLPDFVAGEDILQIELSHPVTSTEIVNESDGTRVEFTFDVEVFDEDRTETVTSYIALGDPNVTADDVIFSVAE